MVRKAKPKKPKAWNETVQLKLRFAESLRIRLEREAKKNGQSMNSEIVQRLEQSFQIAGDQVDLIARSLMGTLEPAVIDRIIEIAGEDDAAMNYDEHDQPEGSK